jgi:hypothetical protein
MGKEEGITLDELPSDIEVEGIKEGSGQSILQE